MFLKKSFKWVEKNIFFLSLFVFIIIIIGGIVEVLPSFYENSRPLEGVKPYSGLELAGRHIYIREGCNNCHSQLIRPFKSETDRYGAFSKSGEYAYDRPFLWGSRRIGPDLHRVGLSRSTTWHEEHFYNAQSTSPGTVMPDFPWFFEDTIDLETAYAEAYTVKKIFNTPYDQEGMPIVGTFEEFKAAALEEANAVVSEMRTQAVKDKVAQGEIPDIVAIIAYLNSLK